MKIGFTEFSYGYAFTENLIRMSTSAPKGAPTFPNLVQEAKLGYDIKIKFPAAPLFFQFKLPETMKRSTAFEVAGGGCPGLSVPFFRMPMMRADLSTQHERLIVLERRYPNGVHYAAPALKTIRAFNTAYNAGKVAEKSVFFSPTDIGPLPDAKSHSVAYAEDLSVAYFCSEPTPIAPVPFQKLSAIIQGNLELKSAPSLELTASAVSEVVISLASPGMRSTVQNARQRIEARLQQNDGIAGDSARRRAVLVDLLLTREVARVDLGVDFVIAQPAA